MIMGEKLHRLDGKFNIQFMGSIHKDVGAGNNRLNICFYSS